MDDTEPVPPWDYQAIGWVAEAGSGPLHVVEIAGETVVLATFLSPKPEMLVTLAEGKSVETLIAAQKWLWGTVTRFPLAGWREASWIEARHDVWLEYEDQGRIRRVTTFLSPAEQLELADWLTAKFGSRVVRETEAANLLGVVWSYLLGMLLAVAGTAFLWTHWDPAGWGRVRGGWLAMLLGREGCAAVGVVAFAVCGFNGWRAWGKHRWKHRLRIR